MVGNQLDAVIGIGSGVASVCSIAVASLAEQSFDLGAQAERWGALGFCILVMWWLLNRSERRQDAKEKAEGEIRNALIKAVDGFDETVREVRRVADRQDDIAQQQTAVANALGQVRCKG